jgi:hypothetical protein
MKVYALLLSIVLSSMASAAAVGNMKAPKGGAFRVQMDSLQRL